MITNPEYNIFINLQFCLRFLSRLPFCLILQTRIKECAGAPVTIGLFAVTAHYGLFTGWVGQVFVRRAFRCKCFRRQGSESTRWAKRRCSYHCTYWLYPWLFAIVWLWYYPTKQTPPLHWKTFFHCAGEYESGGKQSFMLGQGYAQSIDEALSSGQSCILCVQPCNRMYILDRFGHLAIEIITVKWHWTAVGSAAAHVVSRCLVECP